MKEPQKKMQLFSSGSNQANLVLGSDLPQQSWKEIWFNDRAPKFQSSLGEFKVSVREENPMIITFFTSPEYAIDQLQKGPDLVSSSSSYAKKSFDLFASLKSGKPHFAINRAVITLFDEYRDQLENLKNQIKLQMEKDSSTRIIITGYSLGGSIAMLFNLWLFDSVTFKKAKPLCITFGSPLVGDSVLQKALVEFSWNSYFLNVVSDQDTRFFVNLDASLENAHKPFGTFLLCSGSGCSCFEDPETILQLLMKTAPRGSPNYQRSGLIPYGNIVEDLKRKALYKDNSDARWATTPFAASLITQLSAIGIKSPQVQNNEIRDLVESMEKQEKKFLMAKNKSMISVKKLTDLKIFMTYLEWYKKSSKDKEIGYYDCYKKKSYKTDMEVDEFCRRLINYWMDMVEAAEKKPQKEGAAFRKRFLFGATNYRRMVEPLVIAKYYNEKGKRDYEKEGRPRHFKLLEDWLEQWQKEENKGQTTPTDRKKKLVAESLTEDSCFWAKVEEAILSCKLLKNTESSVEEKESSKEKLKKLEDHVLALVKNYSVSPDIFLKGSSFMLWWKDYKEVMGSSYTSQLTNFMDGRKYEKYKTGHL